MTPNDSTDIRDVAFRIGRHVSLLEELLDGPKYKSELGDVLEVAKSTVYYRYTKLEALGLVDSERDGYRLTPIGRLLTEMYLDTLERMASVYEAGELLAELPPDATPPSEVLRGAEPVLGNGQPEQSGTQFLDWTLAADEIQGLLPYASCTFIERLCSELDSSETSIELALEPSTIEYLVDSSPEHCESVFESESSTVYEAEELPPYGLVIVEEPRPEFGLVVYTDYGHVIGFVRSRCECGLEWAREEYQAHTNGRCRRVTAGVVSDD